MAENFGENLENALGLKTREWVKQLIQRIVTDGFLDYRGDWICDQFKETFLSLISKEYENRKQM